MCIEESKFDDASKSRPSKGSRCSVSLFVRCVQKTFGYRNKTDGNKPPVRLNRTDRHSLAEYPNSVIGPRSPFLESQTWTWPLRSPTARMPAALFAEADLGLKSNAKAALPHWNVAIGPTK